MHHDEILVSHGQEGLLPRRSKSPFHGVKIVPERGKHQVALIGSETAAEEVSGIAGFMPDHIHRCGRKFLKKGVRVTLPDPDLKEPEDRTFS